MKQILLFLFLISLIFSTDTFARDPYPNRGERIKYIVAPRPAQEPYDGTITDPQTMIRTNGRRADIISFSCLDPTSREDQLKREGRKNYIYLTDPNTDSLEKATAACQPRNPPYTIIRPPYLKNNKDTSECQGKTYDANCYNWPIGNFLGPHPKAGKGAGGWVTPMAYASSGGPLNACGPNRNQTCDCQYVPYGPPETWIRIFRNADGVTKECVSPPYSTSGSWWTWYTGQMDNIRSQTNLDEIKAVSVHLGIDGEGRPFKSGEGWYDDPGFRNYVSRVVQEVKSRYSGKTIRVNFNRDLQFFLENDLDFHWESLSSDGTAEYLYRGLYPIGYDQIYQNYFFKTNTLGLNPDWPPYYQALLNALIKHTDGITGFTDLFGSGLYMDGRGDFIKFAGRYIGRDINDTPGVWINLRETLNKKDGTDKSGKYGDYMFYLYRPEELEGNRTVPVGAADIRTIAPLTSGQIYSWNNSVFGVRNQYVARKNAPGNQYLSFDIDDGWRYVGLTPRSGLSYDVRIVFLDVGTETFNLQYKDVNNQWVNRPITKTNTNLWKETILNIDNAYFNNNASEGLTNAQDYPTDFRIDSGDTPVVIHIVEVIGNGNISDADRPKAQVECELTRTPTADPLEGIYSIKVNDQFYVRGKLYDQNHQPLSNQRLMFTYNTEWNYAKSIPTDNNGVTHYQLDTANNVNRSGFVGAGGGSGTSPSWYTAQVYFPGNRQYQPSRNDCLFMVTSSTGPNDPNNTRMKITNIDRNPAAPKLTYQIIKGVTGSETVVETRQLNIGKGNAFYADDPSAQTIQIGWTGVQQASMNNITFYGNGSGVTPTPACFNGNLGNLDCDSGGLINEADLSILLGAWAPSGLGSTSSAADLNGDGKVDEIDLSRLLGNWKTQ